MASKQQFSPADDAVMQRFAQLAQDGSALLKSGMSPAELRQRHIAAGLPEAAADLVVTGAQQVGKADKKATAMSIGLVVALPLLLIGIGFAIYGIVKVVKGPNPYSLASQVATEVCGDSRGTGAMQVDGEVVLVQGTRFVGLDYMSRGADGFGDLILDGRDLRPTKILCTESDTGSMSSCDGYYSEEVIEAVEASTSIDEARSRLLASTNEKAFLWAMELESGGNSIEIADVTLSAKLMTTDGTQLSTASVNVAAECPETYQTSGYSSSPRGGVQKASLERPHFERIVRDTLGST